MSEFQLSKSKLGKITETSNHYDASLLFRIPRSENRDRYGISEKSLPFAGVDVWNCYEVSFLTTNGLPVSRVLKLIYSAESQYIIESKSLKLYLNSFNMERFGSSVDESINIVSETIKNDLCKLLECDIDVLFFDRKARAQVAFPDLEDKDLIDLVPAGELTKINFSEFFESPALLQATLTDNLHEFSFRTDLLRSNCRVTNQPDWGDLFVRIKTRYQIDLVSVIAYLISFRKENHFHEEVVEMIYKRFSDAFEPEQLMVSAMYTRRGGIDINPIRVSDAGLIDEAFTNTGVLLAKSFRQ